MKKIIYLVFICIACFITSAINAQSKTNAVTYANTSLSNLTSPTSINQSLLVDKDNAHNIGSVTKAWKNLYLDTAIYFYGKSFIKVPSSVSWNTIVGINAMHDNTASIGNTALGYEVLYSNTTGDENTAIGSLALDHNINGYSNTATGYDALNQNIDGNYNTAIGEYALYGDTSGSYNTASGYYALNSNTKGFRNTAAGNEALFLNTTGAYNTADGTDAGYNVTDGTYNTFIGFNANCGTGGHLTNSTAVGHDANVTTSNTVRIGSNSITSIGGYVNWSNISDGRIKKNIKQSVPGLAFINKLNPITYNLDLDAADKIITRSVIKDKDGKIIQPTQFETDSRKAKEQIVYTGFVAQDVEKAAQSLNYDFSGVDKPVNANTLYGLRYSDFVVPLVKAVQELSLKGDSLQQQNILQQKQIDVQQKINNNLQNQINELKAMIGSANVSYQSTSNNKLSTSFISQNIPNPFNGSTTINYSLPKQFSSASIIVTDKNGNALKQINLSNNKGSVNINAATLSSGAYQYALYVDDKMIAAKQMEIIK